MIANRPELHAKIKNATGYGMFSTVSVTLLLLASNNGFGLLVGKETFMPL